MIKNAYPIPNWLAVFSQKSQTEVQQRSDYIFPHRNMSLEFLYRIHLFISYASYVEHNDNGIVHVICEVIT